MKMKKNLRRTAAALCGGSLLLSLAGCSKTEEVVMDTTVNVDTVTATRGDIELEGTYVGSVGAGESVYVIPMAAGTITEVDAAVGTTVTKGQVLAKIDDESAQLTMKNAQAAYNSASAQAQSTLGGSWNQNVYSLQRSIDTINDSIDTAEDSKDDAEDDYDSAKSKLNKALKNQGGGDYPTFTLTVTDRNKTYLTGSDAKKAAGENVEIKLTASTFGRLGSIVGLGSDSGLSDEDLETLGGIFSDTYYTDSSTGLYTLYAKAKAISDQTTDTVDSTIDSLEESRETAQTNLNMLQGQTRSDTQNTLNAALAQAQVGLDSAQYQLDLYTLTAPIDGVVESVGVTVDNMASSSTVAFTISNKESMTLTFYVTEDVAADLVSGQEVTVTRSGKEYKGCISEIGNAVDQSKGLFKVKATIFDASDMATGVTATLTTTNHAVRNTLLVPSDAIYYDDGQAYVFVADGTTAVRRDITISLNDDTYTAVTDGISEGDEIITTWSPNLKDGAEITVISGDAGTDAASSEETSKG